MAANDRLFEPLQVGNVNLSHRIVMAPLTRFRADDEHVPTPMMEQYYKQRSSVSGTLIITEATAISPAALGYPNCPGIWSKEQIAGWKRITEIVHSNGCFIYLQLWAVGRTAVPSYLEKRGFQVVSSSSNQMPGTLRLGGTEVTPAVPHSLSEEEIWSFIQMYVEAAKNAMAAGFDGVEIHGAAGYLIDQFTQEICNNRSDGWGGSIENRSRFGFEVAKAVSQEIGADRVGFRVSPYNTVQGMSTENVVPQYSDLASRLKSLQLAYLHVIGSGRDSKGCMPTHKLKFLVDIWSNTTPIFLNGGFGPTTARRTVNDDFPAKEVVIVFGRLFLSNPDLPYRIKMNLEMGAYDQETFYLAKSERGYIDYPFSDEFLQAQKKNAA